MPTYNTNEFANPYHLLQPGQDGVRVALTIDRQHHTDFKMLRIQHGTITTIFNLLFLKLHEECANNGFFDHTKVTTPQELEVAIAQLTINLNGNKSKSVNRTTSNKSAKRVPRSTVGKSGEQGNE